MRKTLQDVVVLRLLLIFLLVAVHAFAIYNGVWRLPEGIHEVKAYGWIAAFAYSFMLETFIFVSGYVYGYQVRTRYEGKVDFKTCVLKKLKRLMIPCIVFSIPYYFMFKYEPGFSMDTVLHIINGEGHMWFLRVLFQCFLILYLLELIRLPRVAALTLAVAAAIFLPMRPSYYFLFFYLGYVVQRDDVSLDRLYAGKPIALLTVVYLSVFIAARCFLGGKLPEDSLLPLLKRIANIVYSAAGLLAALALTNYLLRRQSIHVSERAVKFSGYCFGVYLCHQFIVLLVLYDPFCIKTFGTYFLPWVAYATALGGSVLITWLLLKTRTGRFLIG